MTSNWEKLSLAQRFGLASSLVLVLGMAVIGVWVAGRIEEGVTRNAAIKTANFIDSVLAPIAQELARSETLSYGARRAADELLARGALGKNIVSFTIWKRDGRVVYSSETSRIGESATPDGALKKALSGQVVGDYQDPDEGAEAEAGGEGAGEAVLQIYSPIRLAWSGEVIGVAEFYERAGELEQVLARSRAASWIVVGTVTATMFSVLFGIVLRGSRTIDQQSRSLERRVAELQRLLSQNEKLRNSLRAASARTTELNERILRRFSAELHDGPAQLLALAALRIDQLEAEALNEKARKELPEVQEYIGAALREIRLVSKGLAPPELANASAVRVLRMAISEHEARTGGRVAVNLPESVPPISIAAKICIYRFAQEALNNAFRHGKGVEVRLACRVEGGRIIVIVSDKGPGFDVDAVRGEGLGLPGLRERLASLGGEFEIQSAPGEGATLRMWLDLWADDEALEDERRDETKATPHGALATERSDTGVRTGVVE